jgi:hypothetical protein
MDTVQFASAGQAESFVKVSAVRRRLPRPAIVKQVRELELPTIAHLTLVCTTAYECARTSNLADRCVSSSKGRP